MKIMQILVILLSALVCVLMDPLTAYAGPSITYHGRILNSDNTPVTSANVVFKIQVRTPGSESCLLYEETQTKDLSATGGAFSIEINNGTGTRTDSSGFTFARAFSNLSSFNFPNGYCASGTGYTPSATDGRALQISFDPGTGFEQLPLQSISFAPKAIDALQVGGYTANSLLRVNDAGTPQDINPLTSAKYSDLLDLINGTSAKYVRSSNDNGAVLPSVGASPSSPQAGQIWYDQNTNVIKYYNGTAVQTLGVSGSGIASLTMGANLTANGTASSTITGPATLDLSDTGVSAGTYKSVTVDAKGRITSGSNPTTLSGYGIADAIKNNGSTPGIETGADASKPSSPSNGTIYFASDTSKIYQFLSGAWYVMGSAAGSGGTVKNVTGTSPINVAAGTTNPVISIADGSATGQTLRWDTGAWSATSLKYTDLTNSLAATPWPISSCTAGQAIVWNSGSDSFICTTLSIGATQLTGTLQAAQMPAFTGDVTSSAGSTTLTLSNSGATAGTYKSLTVDAKGRVLSGTNPTSLSGYGITNAVENLGNTPGIQTGADASKPASPTNGTIYFASDTSKIYQFLSGAWVLTGSAIGSGGTISSLTSDVTASGSGAVAATVNSVGGSSAANIHSAELAANAATNANTASTIVKRDASGNFSAGTMTGSLTGAASLNVLKSGDTMSGDLTFNSTKGTIFKDSGSNTVSLQAPTTVSSSYVLKWPTAASTGGQVLTSDSSGNMSWQTPSTTATSYSGVLPVANGGTNSSTTLTNNKIMVSSGGAIVEGSALTNGQLLIGSTGAAPQAASLTAGSGVTITNSAGGITIAATGGTVTSASGTAPISVATGTTTPVISIANGSAAGQTLRWDGTSAWAITKATYTDLINSFSGSPWPSSSCTAGQSVIWNSGTDSFSCAAISIPTTQLTGTLQAAQMPAFTGDVTSSAGSTALTLSNSGATSGTYKSVTVDAKGRVTSGTNPTTLAGYGITNAVTNGGNVGTVSSGADASKPSSPAAGDIYVAQDTKIIYQYISSAWTAIASASGSGGTVTSTSVVSANGFAGSVATNTTTPAITLTTSVNGIAKGNGTALSAATSSDITTTLGYAPVNKAGDSMSGNLTYAANTGTIYTSAGNANTVTLQGPSGAIGTSYSLRLPTSVAASNGQLLSSDTSGNLSFVTLSSSSLSDGSSLIKSSQMPANCAAGSTLTFSSPTGTWTCTAVVVAGSNFANQSANVILAGPSSGGAAAPTFRTLVAADLPAGMLTGAGTTNYLPYYSAASTLTNSQISMNGTNVGIKTTSAAQPLEVAGNVNVGAQTTRTTASTNRGQLATGSTYLQTSATSFTLDWNNGNIQEVANFVCDGTNTITMSNLRDGAAYSLLLTGTAAHTGVCQFSSATYTFVTSGGAVAPTSGKNVLVTFAIINKTVVYTMLDNLQ